MQSVKISTQHKRQVMDITDHVTKHIMGGEGVVTVFVAHTTAAITIADLDPGTDQDFLEFLQKITPQAQWRHPHDPLHAPDHLLSSLIGVSLSVPYSQGKLALGNWQRIILVELDGPRERTVMVQTQKE